jgi:hypothetical protein
MKVKNRYITVEIVGNGFVIYIGSNQGATLIESVRVVEGFEPKCLGEAILASANQEKP